MKQCRKCSIELIVGENWTYSQAKYYSYICKGCRKEYHKDNKEKLNGRMKEYYKDNRDKILGNVKKYNEENKDKIKEKGKKYYEGNKEKVKEYSRGHGKEYRAKPETKKKRNERLKLRRQNDPWFDAQCKLRDVSRRLIKNCVVGYKKDFSGVGDLGCDWEIFKPHIESQFRPGMTWENRGKDGWHYDHILPIGSVDPNDREAVLKVLHYTNLRPLWAKDNLTKSSEDKKQSFRNKNRGNNGNK